VEAFRVHDTRNKICEFEKFISKTPESIKFDDGETECVEEMWMQYGSSDGCEKDILISIARLKFDKTMLYAGLTLCKLIKQFNLF